MKPDRRGSINLHLEATIIARGLLGVISTEPTAQFPREPESERWVDGGKIAAACGRFNIYDGSPGRVYTVSTLSG